MSGMGVSGAMSASEVVARAAVGDEDAFREIVQAHTSDMRQVAFVVTGDLDLARDAVAAAWPIAWRKLGSLRDPDALRSWLVAIAANEARRLAKQRRMRQVREIDINTGFGGNDGDVRREDASPASEALDRTAELDLASALGRLSPEDRSLLALRFVVGLNATELARVTGLTPSGTRARLARLVARMRTELSE